MVGKICSISFGCGEDFVMFDGVVKGSYCGSETIFLCIGFEVGVC
jgi:hypothetical protein